MKTQGLLLQAIQFFPSYQDPLETKAGRKIEEKCQVRFEAARGDFIHELDSFKGQTPSKSLVGEGRIRESVTQHPPSLLEGGADERIHMIPACHFIEKEFRLGVDRSRSGVEEEGSDLVGEGGPPWLASEEEGDSSFFKGLCGETDLGGLARAFNPFKGNEKTPLDPSH